MGTKQAVIEIWGWQARFLFRPLPKFLDVLQRTEIHSKVVVGGILETTTKTFAFGFWRRASGGFRVSVLQTLPTKYDIPYFKRPDYRYEPLRYLKITHKIVVLNGIFEATKTYPFMPVER